MRDAGRWVFVKFTVQYLQKFHVKPSSDFLISITSSFHHPTSNHKKQHHYKNEKRYNI